MPGYVLSLPGESQESTRLDPPGGSGGFAGLGAGRSPTRPRFQSPRRSPNPTGHPSPHTNPHLSVAV